MPVVCGSSHPPFFFCVRSKYAIPRATESLRVSFAASKSHHRPGRLRRRAGAYAACAGIIVRTATLAPSSIGILHHAQPLGTLLHIRLMMIHAYRFQPPENLHRAVNVVHAPAPEQSHQAPVLRG